MTALRLVMPAGFGAASDVQVPTELIDARLRTVWSGPIELGSSAEVDVEPGLYAARAYLPSGDVVQADISVEGDAPVELELGAAADEQGETPSTRELLGGQSPPPLRLATRGLNGAPLPAGLRSESSGSPPPEDRPARARLAAPSTWARLWIKEGDTWHVGPAPDFDWTERWTLHAELLLGAGQRLLQIGGDELSWRLISLPPSAPGSSSEVWLTLTEDSVGQDDLAVLAASPNHRAEALLRYLTQGSLRQATVVSEGVVGGGVTAEELLRGKMQDPAAAAVGAYYLLRVGELHRLHDWAANLAKWIDWLPDGPVIHAWQILRSPPANLQDARAQLLEATRRGLPTYTEGLRLLHDGLQLFDAQSRGADRDVAVALNIVSAYAAAADWSTPTTTFTGEDPDHPSLRPVLGAPDDLDGVARLG